MVAHRCGRLIRTGRAAINNGQVNSGKMQEHSLAILLCNRSALAWGPRLLLKIATLHAEGEQESR